MAEREGRVRPKEPRHVVAAEEASVERDFRGPILYALSKTPNGLTIRQLEVEVSSLAEVAGWLSDKETRFDYDLEALMIEGLVELRQDKRLVLTAAADRFISLARLN